jgi:hypothetical protein
MNIKERIDNIFGEIPDKLFRSVVDESGTLSAPVGGDGSQGGIARNASIIGNQEEEEEEEETNVKVKKEKK